MQVGTLDTCPVTPEVSRSTLTGQHLAAYVGAV